jgi:hypothetical protein
MSRRRRRLLLALAGVVGLLFAGRWIASLLADRWWAARLSPAAAAFLTDWHVLRLTLDLMGVLVASAWFIGHLLLVYRAVGSVQVRRNVANLEFREALTPGVLLSVVIGSGALLGLLVGTGASASWETVVLGWHGVTYGIAEPLMQNDLGLYVAGLPLWRAAHGFFFFLIVLAIGIVFGLYLLVGAIRWLDGRPAINNHARSHLGWLFAVLALALGWGYLLEPLELIAGLSGAVDAASWRATQLVAPLLTGVALATAGLSATWALRPRHALVAGGWIVLACASIVGHWMVPPAMSGNGEPPDQTRLADRIGRSAYRLETLEEAAAAPQSDPTPPPVPSLWNSAMIAQLVAGDSVDVLSIEPAVIAVTNRPRPVWLAARLLPGGHTSISAVADDRVSPSGEALFYHSGDSIARPGAAPLLELSENAFRPRAPAYRIGTEGPGVQVHGWLRQVVLAWALQAGELLGSLPAASRVDWALSPEQRLATLVPFADWGVPVPRIIDGEVVWLADGYLAASVFPLAPRASWRGREVGSLQAAFLGVVDATSGVTRIFVRPGADALAEAWADVSRGVVEPVSALPDALLRAAPYPVDLFRLQARQVEQGAWKPGALGGRPAMDASGPPRESVGWTSDTTGPLLLAPYERASERRLSAVLLGRREEGQDVLTLLRVDSTYALPSRSALESRWSRFASFDALSDSIREDGGSLEQGPMRLALAADGIIGYKVYYAQRGPGRLALAWVSIATAPDRMGAGRTLAEGWNNLLGTSVPTMPGSAQATRLDEARRWLERADSALHKPDWTEFGRAWEGLRRALGLPADTAVRELARPKARD